jgi:hypothetical protein
VLDAAAAAEGVNKPWVEDCETTTVEVPTTVCGACEAAALEASARGAVEVTMIVAPPAAVEVDVEAEAELAALSDKRRR